MTIMHASHHTDVSTVNYSSLHTQRKLHHCVTDVKRQYPIAPLFRGDLAHAQTVCTRLALPPQSSPQKNRRSEVAVTLKTKLKRHISEDFLVTGGFFKRNTYRVTALGLVSSPDPLPRSSSPLPLYSTHKQHRASERARERVWGRNNSRLFEEDEQF